MTTRTAMSLTLSALMLGGSMVGCTAQKHGGLAVLSEDAAGRAVTLGNSAAEEARAALAQGKGDKAVAAAEAAVRWQPSDPGYRALLGQSYLQAGRFTSAREALSDALSLTPDNGRVALSLALSQIALGDWQGARATLDAHVDQISAADRGLAMALAGDPNGAVLLLTAAARTPGADAKTRQNLALSLALAGRWTEARAVAALDLGADQVDKRLEQWAAFAYPKSAADQVASLLGVQPAEDHGQPTALALNATVPHVAQAAEAMTVADAAPAQVAAVDEAPKIEVPAETNLTVSNDVAVTAPAVPAVADARPAVTFAPRHEVVQAIPASAVRPAAKPVAEKVAMVRTAPSDGPTPGNFFVQLGAYENAAVAHDGWLRATRRYAAFASFKPQGMAIKANGTSFYRLSVGGFARNEADAMCRDYRAHGGVCFVRVGAGDQMAQWVQMKRSQLASR